MAEVGSNHRPLDRQAGALTIRPPLPHITLHTFLDFSWHIVFADIAVYSITFCVICTYKLLFGVIYKAMVRMGVNFLHDNFWRIVFLK